MKQYEKLEEPSGVAQVLPFRQKEDFQDLYEAQNRSVYKFFASKGLAKEEARELTQDTFLQAYKSWGDYRGDATRSTWLHAIATKVLQRYWRDRGRQKRRAEEVPYDDLTEASSSTGGPRLAGGEPAETPLEETLDREKAQLIRDAMKDLPEGMRDCLVLSVYKGLKQHEIGLVLKLAVGTVKSQLFEARARLRKRLAPHFEV